MKVKSEIIIEKRALQRFLPTIPGVCVLIMRVKSGKSNLLVNLLLGENFYGGEPPIFETIYVISPTASIDRSSQPFHRKELEDRIIILVYIHDDNILAYQQ